MRRGPVPSAPRLLLPFEGRSQTGQQKCEFRLWRCKLALEFNTVADYFRTVFAYYYLCSEALALTLWL